jgi:hypothetical protein
VADADAVTPLCTAAQFTVGPFADLCRDYPAEALSDVLAEATRMCETEAGRRLAPFTLTETHRASAIDPDEYAEGANLPMPIQGAIGWDYAQALGASKLVRHCWVDQYPAHWPDMWAYSGVTVETILSYGGTQQQLAPAQILDGPDDTGHLWFQLGLYLPVGSRIRVTYSGGYTVAIPADLVRAGKFMTAYLIVRELNPADASHDPDLLHGDALMALAAYQRAT